MRSRRKIAVWLAVLFVSCFLAVPSLSVQAADGDYTYKVWLYSGTQGSIASSASAVTVMDENNRMVSRDMESVEGGVVVRGLEYGDRIVLSGRGISLNEDSKYYVQGFRESGKDNNTSSGNPSFVVTEDSDYVVAYGVLGSAVAYTVNYQDADGNALAASETYYGNVGDRPVVAFQYIEGYQPQAYNLTGTLSEDASRNVFTFVYTRTAETGTGTGTTTGTATGTGTTTGAGTGTGTEEGTGTGTDAGDGTAVEPETGAGTEQTDTLPQTGADDEGAENGGGNTQPEELVDLDDEEVPLAGTELSDQEETELTAAVVNDMPLAVKAGIAAAVILAAGMAGFLWYRKKGR